MTQSDFPFGPAAEDEFSEQPPVERSDETRTNILIGAGGALAAIAMAAGFLVFASGDDAGDVIAAAPAGPRTPIAVQPSPTKAPANQPRIEPEPVAEPVGRDPFAPLYRPPVPVVAPTAPVAVVPGAPVGPAVPGDTTTSGGTTTGGMPVGGTAGQPAPSDPQPTSHQLRMVRVYQSGGIWHTELTLDGRVYRPKVGETFAESFQLVSTQESCGSFLFGDERFDLCVGEITVRQQ